jgi:hypothetical protein
MRGASLSGLGKGKDLFGAAKRYQFGPASAAEVSALFQDELYIAGAKAQEKNEYG